jgi:hypothetical protein
MKTLFKSCFVIAIVLTSCAPQATAAPSTETLVPTLAFTVTPTATATKTPIPTATPKREITAGDVGIPWDTSEINGLVNIMPCYLFTSTVFHAGDGFYFPSGNIDAVYHVVAPADGKIVNEVYINEFTGYEINIETPYVLDGKTVFYDVVHTSGLVPELSVGMYIHRGDYLAIKDKRIRGDPIGKWLVDIGFRNGKRQANASISEWTGLGYFSYTRLLQDDFALLTSDQYYIMPKCKGNPIQQNKPYSTPTPTPGGFTYP